MCFMPYENNKGQAKHMLLEKCTRCTLKHIPTWNTLVSLFMASPAVISITSCHNLGGGQEILRNVI